MPIELEASQRLDDFNRDRADRHRDGRGDR
jgi:hypothetical protein